MYPILLKCGPVTLYSYGLLVALGVLAGLRAIDLEAKRMGWNRDLLSKLAVLTFVMGLVGGRVAYVLTRIGSEDVLPTLFDPHAGFVFFGGLIASWLFIYWQSKKRKLPLWSVLDAFALAICVGEGIGRFGCLLGGCCYGKPTSLFWGVVMLNESALGHLHPVQAYEGLALLAFFVFLWSRRARKDYEGESVVFFVGGYSVIRFFIEMFRGDAIRGFFIPGVISTSQAVGLAMIAVVTALHVKLRSTPAASKPKAKSGKKR